MSKNQEIDDFLNQVLKKRDADLGIGGKYSFEISSLSDTEYMRLIIIPNLSEAKALDLFNLFDENNSIISDKDNESLQFKIAIFKDGKEVDFNFLPNVHTNVIKI